MAKKLLIDISKCRECKECNTRCAYLYHPGNNGIKSLREYASFSLTCRHCTDAPCIAACPASALERGSDGVVSRAANLCIACRSCVCICPFGSLMNDFFDTRKSICDYCKFGENSPALLCMETCPEKAITFYDGEPSQNENIWELNDKVYIREITWEKLKYEY